MKNCEQTEKKERTRGGRGKRGNIGVGRGSEQGKKGQKKDDENVQGRV